MLRKIFIITFIFLSINSLQAQNVGIGTTTPNQKLDIANGRLRFTGNPGPGISQGIEFTNPAGTNLNGFLGTYNDSITGMYGFQGSYWSFLHNNKNGNVGLQGNSNPRAPLSFANTPGNKIALWGNADEVHFGLGIQNAQMQLYTNAATSDISFGYGSSSAFTENMRIKGNGNVGIGTASPDAKLDIVGRLQTSEGANFGGNVEVGGTLFALSTISTDASLFVSDDATIDGAATIAGNLQTQGSISTAASLNVSQNATINGNIKIAGGAPGVGKVLTSDADGNASWQTQSYGNTERFMYRLFANVVNNQDGLLTEDYNTGTTKGTISAGTILIIQFPKAGLYHLDVSATTQTDGDFSSTGNGKNIKLQVDDYAYNPGNILYNLTYAPYEYYKSVEYSQSSINNVIDFYTKGPTSLRFSLTRYNNANTESRITVRGHLISE